MCSARNDADSAGNDDGFARNDGCIAGNAEVENAKVGSLMFLLDSGPDAVPHGFSRRNYSGLAPVLLPGM